MKLLPGEVTTEEVKGWRGVHLLHFKYLLCSRKVRVFLALKGIEWASHEVDLRRGKSQTPWFLGINPRGLVPVLVHDGEVHIESNDIMGYLDEAFPAPRLLPQTTADHAAARALLELEDSVHLSIRTLTFATQPWGRGMGAVANRVRNCFRNKFSGNP